MSFISRKLARTLVLLGPVFISPEFEPPQSSWLMKDMVFRDVVLGDLGACRRIVCRVGGGLGYRFV